jgi:transcriptional regulator with XRE-family HTH domain
MDIYDRINLLLAKQGLTRKQLCEAANLSYSTLASQFQRRSKNMSLETVRAIAMALRVSADYLILGEPMPSYFVSEPEGDPYAQDRNDEQEIVAIFRKLPRRSKTLLLAKAYELYDRDVAESKNAKTNP